MKLKLWSDDMKPTCVQVEQLTLSPTLKAMMLYFLLVFLRHGRREMYNQKLHSTDDKAL